MSSPATTAFLTAWRNLVGRQPNTLARIDLPGGTVTLRIAAHETITPDGNVWEGGLKADPIRAMIESLGTGPNPADATIHIEDRVHALPGTGRPSDSLCSYQWQGARVRLYFWEESKNPDGTNVLSWADALQQFDGTVDSFSLDDGWLTLNLLAPRGYDQPTPPRMIDVPSYPEAPDGTQGQPVQIIYGDWGAYPMRPPHATAFGNKRYQEDCGAGSGVVPMILVDPGTGIANVKLLAAGHPCVQLFDRANGYSQFMAAGDVLAPLDAGGVSQTLGALESFLTVNDDAMIAYYGLRPIDLRSGSGLNSAGNAKRAMDVFDETSYASLDQTSGVNQLALELQLPSGGSLGKIEAVDVIVMFRGNASNTHAIRVYPRQPVAGGTGTILSTASTITVPGLLTGSWDAAWWTQNWDFGGISGTASPDRTSIDLRIDFAGGTTNKASIYWAALRVKYRPSRNLVTPASASQGYTVFNKFQDKGSKWTYVPGKQGDPEQYNVSGQFYGNVKGYADDGSGTFTGTPNGLVQVAPDVIRHFLATYGLETSFETDMSAFGSFTKARYMSRAGTRSAPLLACWIGGSVTTVQQVLQKMCEQSLSAIYFDRFTSKWRYHIWRNGAAPDYDWVFTREDCPDAFTPAVTSDVELTQGVRVQYGYDHFKGRTAFESFVTAIGSSQGYSLPTWRDQRPVTITSANKYIDVRWSGADFACTVALATYKTPESFAAAMTTAINAQIGSNRQILVGFGFKVIGGVNDALAIEYSGSTYYATMNAGSYSPDQLAAEAARALNSIGLPVTFGCWWSWQYNVFTVTASATVGIGLAGGGIISPATLRSGWALLGWDATYCSAARNGDFGTGVDPTTGTNLQAPNPRYADCYWFVHTKVNYHDGVTLKWSTGAHAASSCYAEAGFGAADVVTRSQLTPLGGYAYDISSIYSRGMREQVAYESRFGDGSTHAGYGAKQDLVLVADWVRDEASATMLRNARFDFGCTPRVALPFRTQVAPDVQRMRVLAFDPSLDGRRRYPKFGSDGSWRGKCMRVLEVSQDMGPSYHTEFACEEA